MDWEVLDSVTEDEALDMFRDMLNEAFPDYMMGDMIFLPSDILASDPVAFREAFLGYIDSEGIEVEGF